MKNTNGISLIYLVIFIVFLWELITWQPLSCEPIIEKMLFVHFFDNCDFFGFNLIIHLLIFLLTGFLLTDSISTYLANSLNRDKFIWVQDNFFQYFKWINIALIIFITIILLILLTSNESLNDVIQNKTLIVLALLILGASFNSSFHNTYSELASDDNLGLTILISTDDKQAKSKIISGKGYQFSVNQLKYLKNFQWREVTFSEMPLRIEKSIDISDFEVTCDYVLKITVPTDEINISIDTSLAENVANDLKGIEEGKCTLISDIERIIRETTRNELSTIKTEIKGHGENIEDAQIHNHVRNLFNLRVKRIEDYINETIQKIAGASKSFINVKFEHFNYRSEAKLKRAETEFEMLSDNMSKIYIGLLNKEVKHQLEFQHRNPIKMVKAFNKEVRKLHSSTPKNLKKVLEKSLKRTMEYDLKKELMPNIQKSLPIPSSSNSNHEIIEIPYEEI